MAKDNKAGGLLGLYNSNYGASDPSMNVPINSAGGMAQLSPYLNLNPNYLEPEYIPLAGAAARRGRFEMAFMQIGSMVMGGGVIGSAAGLASGLKATATASSYAKSTLIINHVLKRGGAFANTTGVVAVMYSGLGCLAFWIRGKEDHYNTIGAATTTGLLFKSSAGLRHCMIGGAIGFGLSAIYVMLMKDKLKEKYNLGY